MRHSYETYTMRTSANWGELASFLLCPTVEKRMVLLRRIMLLTVAAMMAMMLTTVPAFAAKGGNGGGATVEPCFFGLETSGNIVTTPSGNVLFHCRTHGSAGGGGATFIPCDESSNGNIVLTPSGNALFHCTPPTLSAS